MAVLRQDTEHDPQSDLGIAALRDIVLAINALTQSIAQLLSGVTPPTATFVMLPASPALGTLYTITDSNTVVWGATVAGGGANTVLAFFNGLVWTVAGK